MRYHSFFNLHVLFSHLGVEEFKIYAIILDQLKKIDHKSIIKGIKHPNPNP